MTEFNWDTLLEKQADYIGGDVLIEIDGATYRGPLKALVEHSAEGSASRQVHIEMTWLAERVGDSWQAQVLRSVIIPCNKATPQLGDRNQVTLTRDGSTITLFLADDGNHPDPSLVKNLPRP